MKKQMKKKERWKEEAKAGKRKECGKGWGLGKEIEGTAKEKRERGGGAWGEKERERENVWNVICEKKKNSEKEARSDVKKSRKVVCINMLFCVIVSRTWKFIAWWRVSPDVIIVVVVLVAWCVGVQIVEKGRKKNGLRVRLFLWWSFI